MRKIKIEFNYCGKHHSYVAEFQKPLFGEDDGLNIEGNPVTTTDGHTVKVVTGVADELSVWSIYFDEVVEVDFEAYIDDDGYEVYTLKPLEVIHWGSMGKKSKKTIPFTIQLLP